MKLNYLMNEGQTVKVYLDGKLLDACLEADSDEGVAWVAREGKQWTEQADGSLTLYAPKPGDYLIRDMVVERRSGRVEFVFDSEESRRKAEANWRQNYVPLTITQLVQG